MNIDSFEQLTTRIGRLRLKRCGSIPALTILVAYAPTSSYDEEDIEAFYMDSQKSFKEDRTFYKVIVTSTPSLALEELQRNFISGPTDYNGTNRGKGCQSLSRRPKPSLGSHSSKSRPLYAGRGSHPVESTVMKLTTSLSIEGIARDVANVPKFYAGSDHRLLRARFIFTQKGEKAAKFKKRSPKPTINWEFTGRLLGRFRCRQRRRGI